MRTILFVLLGLTGCGDDDSVDDGGVEMDARVFEGGVDADADADADGDASSSDDAGTDAGHDAAIPAEGCAPLPAPTGTIVRVTAAEAADLPSIVRAAESGTTIVLEDGTYRFEGEDQPSRSLRFLVDGVTLRSASDDATTVILDGEYLTNEIVNVNASNVTIAHVTIMHAVDHPIHVTPQTTGIENTLIYGVRIFDSGEQFIKVNSNGANVWSDRGRIECSHFEMTNDEARSHVEPCCGGCYTGGVDCHGGRGWVVRNNHFEGLYCDTGLAEHAIHFWNGARETLIENNTILNCGRGVGLGLTPDTDARVWEDSPADPYDHVGGIVRNNVIWATRPSMDTGIELDDVHDARCYHNTIWSEGNDRFYKGIDYRWPATTVDVRNNIGTVSSRNEAAGTASHNVDTAAFVDAAGGDFHLAPGASNAIDRAEVVDEAGLDIDGESHGAAPDIGADERSE